MVGYQLENTLSDYGDVNRGVCATDENGLLKNVEEVVKIQRESDGVVRGIYLNGEKREVPAGSIVSMNFWAFSASFMGAIEAHFTRFLAKHGNEEKSECYIPTVVDEFINNGQADCAVLKTSSSWFGVTYPADKAYVVENIKALIEANEYPDSLS
jgi:hypothetical protein